MSIFDSISKKALGVSQGFFGDTTIYKQGSTEIEIEAVFNKVTVEFNSTFAEVLTAEILESHLSVTPKKLDTLTKGSKTWKIDSVDLNNGVFILFLKD